MTYTEKFSLKGKIALVTGGLGLIGKEICKALGESGADVLVLDIDAEAGKNFEKECSDNGLKVKFLNFDITDHESYESFLERIGKFDVLINSAYPRDDSWACKFEELTVKSWKKNVDMHMNSYCLLTIKAAESMKKNNVKGSIVNLGSIYGVVANDFTIYEGTDMFPPAPYPAIKAGIINFSKHAASYYGEFGIRVNSICPGGIFDNQNKDFVARYIKKTPLKRMGTPEDIASSVVFLASDASSYVTGIVLMVDGGWTAI